MGEDRRRSEKREEKVAGKQSAEKDCSWGEGRCTNRTPKMLTFLEDSIDRKTQQCVLKEKKQLPCRLPARARVPLASELPFPQIQAVREEISAYCLGAYVNHEGIDVM